MRSRDIRTLSGPKPLPFFGNIFQIPKGEFHLQMEKWAKVHGPLFLIWLAKRPSLVITDPQQIARILRERPHGFRRLRRMEAVLKEIGGHGLFSAEGAEWKRQRSLIARGFALGQVKAFYPTLLDLVGRLKTRLAVANAAPTGVDVQKEFMRFTVDVTSSLAFGYDPKTLIDDQDLLQQHLEKMFPMISKRLQWPFPYWKYIKFPKDRALARAIEEVRKVIERLIDSARARLKDNPGAPAKTVLESMILAHDVENGPLNNAELLGNIITLMLAGEDTTANSLAWTIYYLAKHKDVYEKIRAECAALSDSPTIEQLEALQWTNAAIHESMRLKPVAPFLFIENLEACDVDGYDIAKGTTLVLLLLANYKDERYFSQPLEFKPERWLPEHRGSLTHHEQVFMPFGFGPRYCPGAMLAMIEMKAALSMIARHFDLQAMSEREPKEVFNFTVMPKGLFTRFNPR